VFVNGCTGGIGEAVTQLALARGAIVIGSCWPNSLARAAELGVEEVIDYTSPQFAVTLAVRAAYDVVFDTVGSLPTGTATRMTKPGGKFLDINATPGKFLHAAITRRHKIFNCVPATGILDEIAKLAVAGQLRATVGEIVPLDRSIALITRFERGDHAAGKGVITTAAAQP
jgi:NADPH:quinone reductase-like Zn-dependent oxidoreductase